LVSRGIFKGVSWAVWFAVSAARWTTGLRRFRDRIFVRAGSIARMSASSRSTGCNSIAVRWSRQYGGLIAMTLL
jgi:hypothetical protein